MMRLSGAEAGAAGTAVAEAVGKSDDISIPEEAAAVAPAKADVWYEWLQAAVTWPVASVVSAVTGRTG